MECNSTLISLLLWHVKVYISWKEMGVLIADIDVNVLDATGDRILAGEELKKENVIHPPSFCGSRIDDRRN
jgi:hypothetical protein